MQFVWLNKQGVASDPGFVVQRMARYMEEYREANRVLRLAGESIVANLQGASFGFGIYKGWRDEKWQPPYDHLPISDEDRDRVVQNIKAAYVFMNGRIEFE